MRHPLDLDSVVNRPFINTDVMFAEEVLGDSRWRTPLHHCNKSGIPNERSFGIIFLTPAAEESKRRGLWYV
jgi:hypothetical protein